MIGSAARRFADPDRFSHAVRAAKVDLVVTGTGAFDALLTRIDLPDLWMQRGRESNARIADITCDTDRIIIMFSDSPTTKNTFNGRGLEPNAGFMYGLGHQVFYHTTEAVEWASMSLAPQIFANTASRLTGRDIAFSGAAAKALQPLALAKLRRQHRMAGLLALHRPTILVREATALALQEALINTMMTSLTDDTADLRDRAGNRRHAALMSRFIHLSITHANRALHISEICLALGISEWTLRGICHEYLNMSPKRYLQLRRLHIARRHLASAIPEVDSVTAIAMNLGFLELGRFAVAYRQLFGESPSAALKRPPDARLPSANIHRLEKFLEIA